MIITKCYIENFGKLSQYSIDLNENINCFNQKNGWGKTTLAAFFKAMLFGLDYSQSKKQVTDRVRYLPWNGGKFGGYVVFDHEGKSYRAECYFGVKAKDDTVQIYDLVANKETDIFGHSIGNSIWLVNKDSYEKTAFVSLSGLSLHNDIIAGKLGDVQEQEFDMSYVTIAIKLLEDSKKRIIPAKGKNGFIGQEQQKIANYKDRLVNIKNAVTEILDANNEIKSLEVRLTDINNEIKNLDIILNTDIFIEKQKNYEDLLSSKKELEEEAELKFNYLLKNVPSNFQIEEWDIDSINILKCERSLSENSLNEKDKLFLTLNQNKQMPTTEDLDSYRDYIHQIVYVLPRQQQILKNEISKLRSHADCTLLDKDIDTGLVEKGIKKYPNLLKKENELRQTIDNLQNEFELSSNLSFPKWKRTLRNFSLILGLLFLIIGGFSITSTSNNIFIILGLVLLLTSVVFIFQTISFKNNNNKRELSTDICNSIKLASDSLDILVEERKIYENYAFEMTDKEVDVLEIFSKLLNILELRSSIEEKQKEYNEYELSIHKAREYLETNFAKYFPPPYTETYDHYLHKIINLKTDYDNLLIKSLSMENASKELETLNTKWNNNLKEYPHLLKLNHHEAINKIKIDTQLLSRLNEELKSCQHKIDEFKQNNDMIMFDDTLNSSNDDRVDIAKNGKNKLITEKNAILEQIGGLNKIISDKQVLVDEKNDILSAIKYSEHKIQEWTNEYGLLDKTQNLLIQANNNISAKYTKSMYAAFKKYMDLVGNLDEKEYEINTKLDVSVITQGQSYNSNRLSSGAQDTIELCMRLALVDAVYNEVHPPLLILDDPFTNLDDKKIQIMEKLILEVSKKNQIIYFSCHSSRFIENV